jgi:putative DNA primase/helicase
MALVAIPAGRKGPIQTGWNRAENAITSSAQAATLTGNIGLAHAYCSPTPTAALDVDDIDGARAWLGGRGVDLDGLLDADDAVQIVSGKPGRAKLVYHLPLAAGCMATVQIVDAETGSMVLEFRCASANGLTVQDVLPPSIHPDTGKPYTWGGKGDWRALPLMPPELLAVWPTQHAVPPRTYVATTPSTPRARATLVAVLTNISADCSYDRYRDVVWAILGTGWPEAEDIARDWCMSAPHRFEEPSFTAVVNSFDPNRTNRPTLGTIIYLARKGGADV